MTMRVLVVGLGRMGMRHVVGALEAGCRVAVVSRRPEGREEALAKGCIMAFPTLQDIEGTFDAAILAGTADIRSEQAGQIRTLGVRHLLLEKPLCQSRKDLQSLRDATEGISTSVNLVRRALPCYRRIAERYQTRSDPSPLTMTVTSGATGFGCNGIHWIDLAVMLVGSGGSLLWGSLSTLRIASGRGRSFGDYGGDAVWGFPDGSRLVMSIDPASAAPPLLVVRDGHNIAFFDGSADIAIHYLRHPTSRKPPYLYAQDYDRIADEGEKVSLSTVTRDWLLRLEGDAPLLLPTLDEALPAHHMLFELLEQTGEDSFPIT